MKTNKTNKQTQAKPKVTKKIDTKEILVNPTDAELLAQTLEIMKGPHHIVDPNKTDEERMKELGWI